MFIFKQDLYCTFKTFPAAEKEKEHMHKDILKGNDPERAGIYIACSLTHAQALWDARNFLGLLDSDICSRTSASETELNCQSVRRCYHPDAVNFCLRA